MTQYEHWGQWGAFSLSRITLTDELDAKEQPVRSLDTFTPAQPIICWVSTDGAEANIGMRWYYQDRLLFEHFQKTQGNQTYTFIESSPATTLPEGDYRVEIYTQPEQAIAARAFRVRQHRPEVSPPQPAPEGHQDLEHPAYVTVPLAFDEVWQIDERSYAVNQVKVTFLNEDEVYLSVAVQTEINPGKLSERRARKLAKPVARYAVTQGYLEKARSLQIDGQSYPLDEAVLVTLINRQAGVIPGVGQVPVYRVLFELKEL